MRYLIFALLVLAGCSGVPKTGSGPVVFLLTTGSGLADPTYSSIKDSLLANGYSVAAIDLPCHGKGEGELACWRSLHNRGLAFSAFVRHVQNEMRSEDAEALIGVSRAGYIALLVAASYNRNAKYVLLSPVIDLLDLAEFNGARKDVPHDARTLDLSGKRIFLAIGKTDSRVNTATAIDLAGRFPNVQLVLTDTPGHSQPHVEKAILHWLSHPD